MAATGKTLPETRTRKIPGGIHHPWRRMFARQLDLIVFGVPATMLVFWLMAYALYPPIAQYDFDSPIGDMVIGAAIYGVWIPIEAGLLASVGATPAKWLFGIRVRDQDGTKLTFGRALKRASLVFIVGEGFLAIPIVTAITRFIAYRRLTRVGNTEWDRLAKSVVTHQDWGAMRWAGCVLAYLVLMVLVGSYIGANQSV